MVTQTAVDWLALAGAQREAAIAQGEDVLLRAGAGTGKTRTLVGRYLTLLERGASPPRIAAITFTEKAAREMRNRIRGAIERQASAADPTDTERLRLLASSMDAARIGTIHSLCAEILRTHPAEAGLDPEFEVLDEGAAAILQREMIERTLGEVADNPTLAEIYRYFSVWGLRRLLTDMLGARLDVAAAPDSSDDGEHAPRLMAAMAAFHDSEEVRHSIETLQTIRADGYFEEEATESMATMALDITKHLDDHLEALGRDQLIPACLALFSARQRAKRGIGKSEGPARQAVDQWISAYDRMIDPWLGGSSKSDKPPNAELEEMSAHIDELAKRVFERARDLYTTALEERSSLDFDALEAGATSLLHQPAIAKSWQAKLEHILVDEFQDTNARQREMIEALVADRPGKLFVVGDAQQSIYRFRGADVTVFRQLGDAIGERGRVLALDRTYRQHPKLLSGLDRLLEPVFEMEMGDRLFRVPYRPLESNRDRPRTTTKPPFIEFVLGVGENASAARPIAAAALVQRLLELNRQESFAGWDDVALLFRASTGFPWYEDALERAGIPYVTIAGRGFFDRPEIREIVNMLRALAEPWNDAAMVGFLRSAAVGMTDAAIFRLRYRPNGPEPLADAVRHQQLDDPEDESARQRAIACLDDLQPLVDRLPVASLLKRLIDWTDARAMLATIGQRPWANLDKLLADARASELTRVREFLEYLDVLKDVGVREGEAAADAEGAVTLLTIHKAKGLEFPTVVLADAGYAGRHRGQPYYPIAGTGPAVRADQLEDASLAYRWAKAEDDAREEAEEARLLYVALTRAMERVLVSGHLTLRQSGPSAPGWLGGLLDRAGIQPEVVPAGPEQAAAAGGGPAMQNDEFGWSLATEVELDRLIIEHDEMAWPADRGRPLYRPIERTHAEDTDEGLDDDPARGWRATGRSRPPASVVGVLVHRAIERWAFPPNERLDGLLSASAFGEGLVESSQQQEAIGTARQLLARFKSHPLWQAIDSSTDRYHELPFTYQPAGHPPDSGAFDLVYRNENGWQLLDFKTDHLRDEESLEHAVIEHRSQLDRYQRAASRLLGGSVGTALVFLDYQGEVQVTPMSIEARDGSAGST
ncbi:MAG: UvrD-helicase domain-containing protein [Anaerolineales bacterium]